MAMKLGKPIQCNTPYQLKMIQRCIIAFIEVSTKKKTGKLFYAELKKLGQQNISKLVGVTKVGIFILNPMILGLNVFKSFNK